MRAQARALSLELPAGVPNDLHPREREKVNHLKVVKMDILKLHPALL